MMVVWFLSPLLLLFPMLHYLFFRVGMKDRFKRKKVVKRDVRILMRGKKNFWWYQAIHEKYGIGVLYPLNIIFTVLFLMTLVMMLLFGWLRVMNYVNAVLYTALAVLGMVLAVFGMTESNIAEYGKPFISLRIEKLRTSRRKWGFNSSLLQIFTALGCTALGCGFVWALVLLS